MKTLLETLGPESARRFLTFALIQLEQRSQELVASLRTGDLDTAANCAHKLKGTVHLYSSPGLQDMLNQIASRNHPNLINDDFLTNLENNLIITKKEIHSFLSDS